MIEPPDTGDWVTRAEGSEGRKPASEPRASKVPHAPRWPVVPGYEILEELGRGGMGVVYKAWQVSLKRLVALKLIRDAALAGPQERARFRIEAEVAARVRHPNVVQIYEVGEHEGRPYFAMELIEGDSLDKVIAGQPQPVPLAAELVRVLALAVQHAHAQLVIHRDLKPANILVSGGVVSSEWSRPGSPLATHHSPLSTHQLKITDFGLAKRLDSESTAWTRDGAVLGTVNYMAPEQAAGRVREIGPATDVYALGAILYELLTGRPPFQADSWNDALQQVLHDEPAAPTRLQTDVPRDLETICLKCLEKELGRRYASAADLADDLGRFLEAKPVAAVPPGEGERLARLAGRDGYQIVGEIGRGPRSIVYHALHGPLKRPVALKVFTPGLCTKEEWEARLGRTAELFATLSHPQVVSVQRAGWWEGAPFVAVEYIPQGSLVSGGVVSGEWSGPGSPLAIHHSPLTTHQLLHPRSSILGVALRLVEQLTEIISYLHRQGVVHGNLKPSNVLLAADGIPRLVDFHATGGWFLRPPAAEPSADVVVRSPDRATGWQGQETLPQRGGVGEGLGGQRGEVAGLGYLAPELVKTPGAEPRPYTDIYGLGMILYELLTGRPAFVGSTARETLELVRSHDPVPPSRFNPQVTPHLEGFCLRCLRKNPWRRYRRAYDLSTRLRHFQQELKDQGLPDER